MSNINNFIESLKEELSTDPDSLARNFDELMAIYDLINIDDQKISKIHSNCNSLPTSFDLLSETDNKAKELKERIDSHIEVSKYNHRYIFNTAQENNIVKIQLFDKTSR